MYYLRDICPLCDRNDNCGKEFNMIEIMVNIDTIDKVKEFCELCSKCAEDVLVYSQRYIVSAKSLMGLFSLDLTKPIKVEFEGGIPHDIREEMKKFIVY